MIPYIGGKSSLSSWIISNFPVGYDKMTYCEIFGGGGWVLFKKDPSYVEIYNDKNSHLVNLFKVIRDEYPAFAHRAEWSLHSREMYYEAREKFKDDHFVDKIEEAMHYAIMRVQSFSGKGGWAYQVAADKVSSGKWLPFLKRLELINARLKKVQIDCLDYEQILKKYDTSNTLFYLDPPYVEAEHYYNTDEVNFGHDDHVNLARILTNIKGKYCLSYYEHPLVRELYPRARIITKDTSKASAGITRGSKKTTKPKAVELLIMNY